MAKSVKGNPPISKKDAVLLATVESEMGLPVGGLRSLAAESQAAQAAAAAAPPAMGQPMPTSGAAPVGDASWQAALSDLRPAPTASTGVGQELDTSTLAAMSDQASEEQDRVLANMLNDSGDPQAEDTSKLPRAVDRYLDKILA